MSNDPHHDHSHHHQAPLPTCFSSLQVRRGPCLPPFPQSSSSSSEESVLFSERLEANSGYSLTTQHGSCLRELAKGTNGEIQRKAIGGGGVTYSLWELV